LRSSGRPRAGLEVTSIRIVPFDEGTEEQARAEGEGGRTLGTWRRIHERFWRALRSRVLPEHAGWCQSVEATWGSPASSRVNDSAGVRKPSRRRGRLLISSAIVVR